MRFRKAALKLLSLVKPQAKPISLTERELLLSKNRAELILTESKYWWGVWPVSRVKSRVK